MSTLNVSNITDGTDTVETGYVVNGSAKILCNYTSVTTTTIRDSLNVSSLTDLSSGQTTVSFTNSMAQTYFHVFIKRMLTIRVHLLIQTLQVV